MKAFISIVFLFLAFDCARASALGDLAATMKAGEWKELATQNLSREKLVGGGSWVTAFSTNLTYDPATQKILFIGGGHGALWNFLIYDIATITLAYSEGVTAISVYNLQGRRVADLTGKPGHGSVVWQPRMPGGLYVVRVKTQGQAFSRRVLYCP